MIIIEKKNPQKNLGYTALVSACVGLICTNSTTPPPRLDEVRGAAEFT